MDLDSKLHSQEFVLHWQVGGANIQPCITKPGGADQHAGASVRQVL